MQLNRAKELFYKGDYQEALQIFSKLECNYEAGLSALMLFDEALARSFWQKEENNCLGCNWGIIVLDIIHLKIKTYPGYFQVRAFLEVYITLFIKIGKLEWAENLISSCNILIKCNPETYKFIARALFANGYMELTHHFVSLANEVYYNDPEAHFINSQAYFIERDYKKALEAIIEAHNVAPDYFPAQMFKKAIEAELDKT